MHCIKIFYILLLIKTIKASENAYGVLAAETQSERENFCIIYFKEFAPIPEEKSKSETHLIEDARTVDWCNSPQFDSESKILLLKRQNCSVSEQASNVQAQGGKGILYVIPGKRETTFPVNESLAKDINITVGMIAENSVKRLHDMGDIVFGRMFSPDNMNFDFSLLFIWVVAMFTVTVGSYWSGRIRFTIYSREISVLPAISEDVDVAPRAKRSSVEESSINVSSYYVAFFVLCMGGMLLLLYFFFDYLVYFIIGLFVLASLIAMYSCLEPLVLKIPGSMCKISDVRLFNFIFDVDFRQILLLCFSCAVSITWFVIRKQKHAWILQDILGVAFCIHMLKSIRLPSLKICAVLLVLLFFYDIFFVFVTPYLTGKAESVMEEVATGGKSDEMLPMVLKVVHFKLNALAVCYEQYSILGFGDILVPGLLISYCHGFDLITNKKSLYFPITVATYGIGLLITFVGLFLMNTAQPALLYLVPTTLIPPIILGWCKGELALLWSGFKIIRATEEAKCPDVQVSTNTAAPAEATDGAQVFVQGGLINAESITKETPCESTGEKKHLLR